MLAGGIASSIGIKRIIVPRLASVFSAFGIGFSHLAHEYQQGLDSSSLDVGRLTTDLESRARRDMYGEGVDPDACQYVTSLWGSKGDVAVDRPLVGRSVELDEDLEDPRLTLRAVFELPTFTLQAQKANKHSPMKAEGTETVNLGGDRPLALSIVDDKELKPGKEIKGPALIRGNYLTNIVDVGWELHVSSNGDLILEAK